MTTAIVLETAKGELVLALSLGILLVLFSVMVNMLLLRLKYQYSREGFAS
jgi:ABC-type tungstate transport system substrate-binding protein